MRRIWIPLTALAVAAVALTTAKVKERNEQVDSDDVRVTIGLHIAPLPLNPKAGTRTQIGLGSYLVNAVGDCNGCHSTSEYAAGGNPFLGQPKVIDTTTYLKGGQAFGPFISRNLRPEIGSGLPAGLTYAQFASAMRHGTDFDNPGQLLQVMPWPAFQSMAEADLQAIYHYLRALPAVAPPG